MDKIKKKLAAVSNEAQEVIHRMRYIQSVINTYEDSDDLQSIENAIRIASSDITDMFYKVSELETED